MYFPLKVRVFFSSAKWLTRHLGLNSSLAGAIEETTLLTPHVCVFLYSTPDSLTSEKQMPRWVKPAKIILGKLPTGEKMGRESRDLLWVCSTHRRILDIDVF